MSLTKLLRVAFAALGLLAIASAAASAGGIIYTGDSLKDGPVYEPVPVWQGFYVGGNIGGEWSVDRQTGDPGAFFFPATAEAPAAFAPLFIPKRNNDQSGAIGGVQLGYNWEKCSWCGANWLLGVEGDIGFLGNNSNENQAFLAVDPFGRLARISANNNPGPGLFGDLTARAGYLWLDTLIYAKGGFALLGFPGNTFTEIFTTPSTVQSFRETNSNDNDVWVGWTLGFGLEYMINPNWTLKLEYMYYDFGERDRHCCNDGVVVNGIPVNNFVFREMNTFNTLKAAFNYHLGPDYVPLK
jgi:outer membrane immunogenic protein